MIAVAGQLVFLTGLLLALAVRAARAWRERGLQLEAAQAARDSYRLALIRAWNDIDFLRSVIGLPPAPDRPVLPDLSRTARSQETR